MFVRGPPSLPDPKFCLDVAQNDNLACLTTRATKTFFNNHRDVPDEVRSSGRQSNMDAPIVGRGAMWLFYNLAKVVILKTPLAQAAAPSSSVRQASDRQIE